MIAGTVVPLAEKQNTGGQTYLEKMMTPVSQKHEIWYTG